MRRSATEVILELENRVAQLEKQAKRDGYLRPELKKAIRMGDYKTVRVLLDNLYYDINPSYYTKGNDPQRDDMSQSILDTIKAIKLFESKKAKIEKQIQDLQSNLIKFQKITDGALSDFQKDWVDPSPHGLR